MTPFSLRCRVCEQEAPPGPLEACNRCAGPNDVSYDWQRIRASVGRDRTADGPPSLWRAPAGDAAIGPTAHDAAARVFSVHGTYDECRRLELELGALFPWGFLEGNLHPYASEGAKTISFEICEQLGWELPDAVVCP